MKAYRYIIMALGLCLASCGDFLEIEPKTFVSEDNFWNEKTDIDQMVAGTYVKMQQDAFIQRCIMWGETRSDNIIEGLNASGQTSIYRTLKENLLSTNSYTTWVNFYAVINQANTIIEMAPVVSEQDPVYTESDVNATIAEMKALRALCYFYLVRAFKDVPFYTYAIQSEDEVSAIAPSDGDSIVKVLIADLEDCVSNALKAYPSDSNSSYNSTKNRITQNAIYSILCDLCLWDGQYQKVVTYADIVIESKYNEYQEDYSGKVNMTSSTPSLFQHEDDTYNPYKFPLYPCYTGQTFGNDFSQTFGDTQNGFESIFELAFTYDGTSSNYLSNSACGTLYGNYYSSSGNSGSGYLAASEDLVNDLSSASFKVFDTKYDCRWYSSLKPDDASSPTEAYAAKFVNTNVSHTSYPTQTLMPFTTTYSTSIYANRNWIFYRLTDVMLMQAEALIELAADSEIDDSGSYEVDDQLKRAYYIIWAVARRSDMTASTSGSGHLTHTLSQYSTKSQMLTFCLKERRAELLFEGKRWFDLLRQCHKAGTTDYVKSYVSAKGGSGGSTTLFTNYESLFWPYNKDEVKNNDLLSQKAYYGDDDDEGSFTSTK